jgi:hypothetical protein
MARYRAPAKAELELMLPGFRFLFAAVVLSMSILIFGLGAAALLRAAHDQFASIPSRRALPEPVFAQQPAFTQPSEAPAATLAMLRVEPPVVEKAPEGPATAAIAALVEPAPEAVPVPPVETEQLAALRVDVPTPPEAVKPETVKPEMATTPEPAPPAEAAPAQAGTPAAAEEIKVAAVQQAASPTASEAAPAALEPAIVPPAPESIGAATKVATLGAPAVIVEGPATAKPKSAQADKSAIRKRQQAKRAKERRRLAAQRARLAREAAAAQQQQADPFAPQPTITTAATATTARRR